MAFKDFFFLTFYAYFMCHVKPTTFLLSSCVHKGTVNKEQFRGKSIEYFKDALYDADN